MRITEAFASHGKRAIRLSGEITISGSVRALSLLLLFQRQWNNEW